MQTKPTTIIKRSLLCLFLLSISLLFYGCGNKSNNNASSSKVSASVVTTDTPIISYTATPRTTNTPLPTSNSQASSFVGAHQNDITYSGTYKNHQKYNGVVTYTSNGATVERKINNGKLSNELFFTTKNVSVSGYVSKDNTLSEATIKYSNGDTYVGHLVNGKKRGQGKYYWTNGAWYSGSWYNDTMSGKGIYYFTNDSKSNYLEGTFYDGKPLGTVIYVSESRVSYKTTWNNGKCIKIERQ